MGLRYWSIFGALILCLAMIIVVNVVCARPYLHDYHDWADLIAPYSPVLVALTVFCFAVLRDRFRSRENASALSQSFQSVAPLRAWVTSSMPPSPGKRLSAAGLRAFFQIADAWRLTVSEQQSLLGDVAERTMRDWKARPESATLSVDQLDRLSYVLGIYEALHNLFAQSEQADAWIRRENSAPPFGGRAASDMLFSGHMEDLIIVRRYLDAAR
jgi:hypothetical protein